ncbi:hypothetical protein D3C80_1670750 [compost metagenome]
MNAIRYNSILNAEKKIKWWNPNECVNVYASPFIDNLSKRGIVGFGKKNNGRIACCINLDTFYILIECWG